MTFTDLAGGGATYGSDSGWQEGFRALEQAFYVTVSGRSVTPHGALTIHGVAYQAASGSLPGATLGTLTLTGAVDGVIYDLYAAIASGGMFQLIAYPQSAAHPGDSPNQRYIGTVTDYPSRSRCQVLLVPTLPVSAYAEPQADGWHVKAFGGAGTVGGYGQIVLESPTRINDLQIYADDTFSHFTSPKNLNIECTDATFAGTTTVRGGAASLIATFSGSAATVQSINGGVSILAGNGAVSAQSSGGNFAVTASGGDIWLTALSSSHKVWTEALGSTGAAIWEQIDHGDYVVKAGGGVSITAGNGTTPSTTALAVGAVTISATGSGGAVFQSVNGSTAIQATGTGGVLVQSTGSGGVFVQSTGTGGTSISTTSGGVAIAQTSTTSTSIVSMYNSSNNAGAYTQIYATGGRAYVQSINNGCSVIGGTDVLLQSGLAGDATLFAAGTGKALVQGNSGGVLVLSNGNGNLDVQGNGSGSVTLKNTASGPVVVSALAPYAQVNASNGYIVFSAPAAGQIIYSEADTHYWYNGSTSIFYGYVTSAALHHNTLISAPTKSFRIPHPTKPDMILEHNAVEMPEACIMHRGVVTLDATGKAALVVPGYASALTDPTKWTVMLTPVGPTPSACSYQYAGQLIHGTPGATVSWLLIGMRLDVPPTVVEAPQPAEYDPAAFPYPARINAMRDTVGAAHIGPARIIAKAHPVAPVKHAPLTPATKPKLAKLAKPPRVRI